MTTTCHYCHRRVWPWQRCLTRDHWACVKNAARAYLRREAR